MIQEESRPGDERQYNEQDFEQQKDSTTGGGIDASDVEHRFDYGTGPELLQRIASGEDISSANTLRGFSTFFNQADFSPESQPTAFPPFSPDYWEKRQKADTSFIEPPTISPDLLPAWMGDMAKGVAASTLTPVDMSVMAMFFTVATCVQRLFTIERPGGGHTEELAFWGLVVLGPGNLKTKVYSSITAPLSEWVREENARLIPEIRKNKARQDIAKRNISDLSKNPEGLTEESLADAIAKQQEIVENEIYEKRLFVSDVTNERCQNLLAEQGNRVAILNDEGGVFDTMTGLYSNGVANIDIYLKAYSGSDYPVERQGRSVNLQRPNVTIGLCIQPRTLKDMSTGRTKRSLRERGFFGRFFYCVPSSPVGDRDIDDEVLLPEGIKRVYVDCIKKLLSIIPNRDEEGNEVPYRLKLSAGANEEWKNFYREIEPRHKGDLRVIDDWSTKLCGNTLRLAGLIHLAKAVAPGKNNRGVEAAKEEVTAETMREAIAMAKSLIPHALEAYQLMGETSGLKCEDLALMVEWLVREGKTEVKESEFREISTKLKKMKAEQFGLLMKRLEQCNVLSSEYSVNTGGRPSICRAVNPNLKDQITLKVGKKGGKVTDSGFAPFTPMVEKGGKV